MTTSITRAAGWVSEKLVKPRRSEKSTVQSRSTPPRRRFPPVIASTSSTTPPGTKRANRSRTRSRSIASVTYRTDSDPSVPSASASSGYTYETIHPPLNVSWTATVNSAASARASSSERQRPARSALSGSARPRSTIKATLIQPGASLRGMPRTSVSIALAHISTLGMTLDPLVAVEL